MSFIKMRKFIDILKEEESETRIDSTYGHTRHLKKIHGDFILHREDGPAFIYDNGESTWWLNGIRYHFEDWLAKTDKINDSGKPIIMKELLGLLKRLANFYTRDIFDEVSMILSLLESNHIHWPELDIIRKYAEAERDA